MLEHYYRELQNFLIGKLKDRDAAADLAQESYLRVLSKQQAGEAIDNPRALLYRIASNLVVDRHRRMTTRGEEILIEENPLSGTGGIAAPAAWEPEAAAMSAQGVEILLETIDALPPRCREAFILYKFDGCSYAEVGERMGISVRTVEMQLQIAMAACWACLERLQVDGASVQRIVRSNGKGRQHRS